MTSASERLRALGMRIAHADVNDYMLHTTDLENALPLIADVVEAAELHCSWEKLGDPEGDLDAALTALRDALEEK